MPNQITTGQATDPASVERWVHIDDFSAGIWNQSHVSGADPQLSAPLGAAFPDNTWCCAALPSSGLGPLPKPQATAFADARFPGTSTTVLHTGFIVNPEFSGSGGNELLSIFEADDGTSHYVRMFSIEPATGPTFNAVTPPTATNATTPGFFGAPYPVWTRMNVSGSVTPHTPGPPPKLVFPGSVLTDAHTTNGHLWVYPSIAAPTTYVCDDIVGSAVTGQSIAYANRIICLVGNPYPWPPGGGAVVNTNENVNFTDPPNSNSYAGGTAGQYTWLTSEWPWGYGAWGSVSTGELLLIKKTGGGIAVNGDIDAPTSVIEWPGITPTGGMVGSAGATPSGLYYCAQNLGVWKWNGGNASEKVSHQLADNFFDTGMNNLGTNNYGFFCYPYQKWVMVSNNYALDTEMGGWWRWMPDTGTSVQGTGLPQAILFWYSDGFFGKQLYAASGYMRKTHNDPWWVLFDNTVPTYAWSWESVPVMTAPNAQRVLDVRQVIVRASDPSGSGTCSLTLHVNGTAVTATSPPTIGTEPTIQRWNVGVVGQHYVQVQLLGQNSNTSQSAPIVHSIDIGVRERAMPPASD